MELWTQALIVMWTYLPAGVANVAPVISKAIFPRWNTTIDHFLFGNRILLGSHKTIRGLASGIFLAIIVFGFQQYFFERTPSLLKFSLINYAQSSIAIGALLGFSALFGDALKSLVKRAVKIPPGNTWFPFDQIDWILGAVILSYPIFYPTFMQIVLSVSIGITVHIFTKILGFILRLDNKYI